MKTYDFIGVFSEGYAKVKLNGMWGLIDGEGNEIVPPEYVQVGEFHDRSSRSQTKTRTP